MKKSVLITDSGMSPIKDDSIKVLPVIITDSNGKEYLDGIDISNKDIIRNIYHNNILYKTSSPLVSEYENAFKVALDNGMDVIHLSMSSGISEGSVNTAFLIASDYNDEYENNSIYVVDSLTGAVGGTLISEYAKDLISKGLSTPEVVNKLDDFKKRLFTSFFVPDPSGFLRSGRNKTEMTARDQAKLIISNAAVRTGFKFRVDFNETGNLIQNGLLKGKTHSTYKKMVSRIVNEQNVDSFDENYVVVGNVLKENVDMDDIKDYLYKLKYFKKIIEKDFPGAVASYGCNDLCGISLVKKKLGKL